MTQLPPNQDVDPLKFADTIGMLLSSIKTDAQADKVDVGPIEGGDISFSPADSLASPTPPAEAGTTTSEGTTSPVSNAPVSGKFGEERPGGHVHAGVDLSVGVGTTVVSAISGTVTQAGGNDPGGYGNLIEITGANGVSTRYAHLSHVGVTQGDKIRAGQPIGKSGGQKGAAGAGNSEGPHLHFEVLQAGRPVDPMAYLAGAQPIVAGNGSVTGTAAQVSPQDAADTAMARVLGTIKGEPVASQNQSTPSPTTTPGNPGSDPDSWIRQAMAATGVDESWFAPLKARMMQESGGQNIPQGIVDINTQQGTPAFGPMQVIEPTFRSYALPGHQDWHNPVDNTIAAIRYIMSRYGHPSKLPKGGY